MKTSSRCRTVIAGLVAAGLIAGCGAASGPSTGVRAARLVTAKLASHWPAIGHPVALRTRCAHGMCTMTYEYTPPDGYRREYRATVPVRCARTCSADWSRFHVRILHRFDLDHAYPVGQCVTAMQKALKGPSLVNLATDPAVQTACAGVHKGIYTGPLLTSPGG